jgi:hypothetical protein
VGLPLVTAYALARVPPRPPKRLYGRRGELMERLMTAYREARGFRDERARSAAPPDAE